MFSHLSNKMFTKNTTFICSFNTFRLYFTNLTANMIPKRIIIVLDNTKCFVKAIKSRQLCKCVHDMETLFLHYAECFEFSDSMFYKLLDISISMWLGFKTSFFLISFFCFYCLTFYIANILQNVQALSNIIVMSSIIV